MGYIPFLKWAAGAATFIPDELEFDTSALLNLVDAHNLSGRFLRRINESNASWITPKLVEGVRHRHEETKCQLARNVTALSELRHQLSDKTRVILIKGISTYILTEREETMRAGDIDILSNNQNEVVRTLLRMGYTQTRLPFMHEIGEYTKDTTEFDIHDYFPVYGYTKALLERDLLPQHHERIWQQSYELQNSRITFEDLEQYANCGRQSNTSHVLVPDPNLLAVIICAHAFMNYTNMWSISHREKAYVRLGEIADLFSLAAHPSFSKQQFLAYVNRYQAHDAVEWAASIAVSVFGKNPLPIPVLIGLGEPLHAKRFPRCLWWNFWASLSSDTDDLLRTQWLSMGWMTEQIGANRLSVRDGQTVRFATTNAEHALPLTRCITQTSELIPLLLHVEKSEKGIGIHLHVHTTSRVDMERVRIDLGDIAGEWIYVVNDNRQAMIGSPITSTFLYGSAGFDVSMELSWETLRLSNLKMQSVALLIGVARQLNSGGVTASILLPLVIEF